MNGARKEEVRVSLRALTTSSCVSDGPALAPRCTDGPPLLLDGSGSWMRLDYVGTSVASCVVSRETWERWGTLGGSCSSRGNLGEVWRMSLEEPRQVVA